MFTEDNEVTEVAEVEETNDVSTDHSAEAVDDAVEATTDDTDAIEPSDDPPEVFDWNGELDDLRGSDWLAQADMSVREAITKGVETKYRNFERGFTKAFQENAGRRKTLDRREKDIREQEMRVQKWLHGDVDPLEEKQREIESLKQANEAAIRALRDEHEEAASKMQGGRVDEIEKLTQTIVEREERIRGYEETEANAKATKDQAEVNEFTTWLQEKAPHVYGDEEALYDLCVNVAHGKEWGDALKMTLALHPSPAAAAPAREPDPVPPAVGMMNMGSGSAPGTEATQTKGFDELLDDLRRQAQADDAISRSN